MVHPHVEDVDDHVVQLRRAPRGVVVEMPRVRRRVQSPPGGVQESWEEVEVEERLKGGVGEGEVEVDDDMGPPAVQTGPVRVDEIVPGRRSE